MPTSKWWYVLVPSPFRVIEIPYRNMVGFLIGLAAAVLLLSSGAVTSSRVAFIFVLSLLPALLIFLWSTQIRVDRFAWGLLIIAILGFGIGGLVYQYRHWWRWLWNQCRRFDQPHEWALLALFLIGAILGVFVVRNWPKEQEAFIKSLSGILGGTFVAAVFVKMFEDVPQMSQKAFALYALGFAISGTINLINAAWLIARYTNKRSITSRAILDFMYGSERAEIIDRYFLKNFEEDPDYAKRWLTTTLLEFRELLQREFAERMEVRRKSRQHERPKWHYYELITIKHETHKNQTEEPQQAARGRERKYKIIYRRLVDNKPSSDSELGSFAQGDVIQAHMFRVAVSIKNADLLEYIVAPGEYHGSFPRLGSVAGLALEMRQTIVMDRDRDRKFRNKDHKEGISPGEIEQSRGLDEIDFLSYVSTPVVSRLGESTENALGILNVDTRIFVSRQELEGEQEEGADDVFSISITRKQLTDMAALLYEDNDEALKYLENLTKIVRPILELYARCRVGAT